MPRDGERWRCAGSAPHVFACVPDLLCPLPLQLSHPEMDSVRHKMLRCISIWRDWRVYTPAALSHIRQLAAQGASCRASDREEGAAAEAWAALLQLQTLRFLAQTPSGRKVR